MADPYAQAIRELGDQIPTIRTGTVLTDYSPIDQTYVTLDNDPSSQSVKALSAVGFLAAGTRVLMESYPPRGLAIVGILTPRATQGQTWQFITTGTSTFPETLVPAGAVALEFLLQAGGGGSGGIAATAAGTTTAGGAGGAGGDALSITIPLDGLQWSLGYAVGGGGIGGAAGNNAGTAGGNTQITYTRNGTAFAAVASGGFGGGGMGPSGTGFRSNPGLLSGRISGDANALGAIVYPGQPGTPGVVISGVTASFAGWGGQGGNSLLGSQRLPSLASGDMKVAVAATGGARYGGGASGPWSGNTNGVAGAGATAGANGGAGLIAWRAVFGR